MTDKRRLWAVEFSKAGGVWRLCQNITPMVTKREAEAEARFWNSEAALGDRYRAWAYVPEEGR